MFAFAVHTVSECFHDPRSGAEEYGYIRRTQVVCLSLRFVDLRAPLNDIVEIEHAADPGTCMILIDDWLAFASIPKSLLV